MPYYVHPKDVTDVLHAIGNDPELSICHYDTAQDANDHCDRATHKVTFIASEHEAHQWREREQDRFDSGEYMEVPWQRKNIGTFRTDLPADTFRSHYAHLSLKNPGLIAYTKSEEHGYTDRQTSVKPGRYLEEFYKDEFSAEEKAEYIAACSAEAMALQIATTANEIETVYRNGPRSCMSHDTDEYQSECHPTAVYGNSDLAIAYYGPINSASARGIIWPEKKKYGRLYGGEQVLRRLLEANGYTSGSMRGAYIRAIAHDNGGYVMPYIDGLSGASYVGKLSGRKGNWIKLDNEGPISCCETNGVSEGRELATCSRCDAQYDPEDDQASGEYCPSCSQDQSRCSECDEYFFREDGGATLANGRDHLCDSCATAATVECAMCDTTWIERVEFTSRECQERIAAHTSALCVECAIEYRYCDACEQYGERETDNGRCSVCNHAARCAHTGDLIAVLQTASNGLPRSMPRDIAEYMSGSADNIPIQDALRGGTFHVSNSPYRCRCLIHDCHAPIMHGDIYFRTQRGFGYCRSCAETQGLAYRINGIMAALTQIIDESMPIESESLSHAS